MNVLSPLGWLYGVGTDLRNFLYDRGIFKSHKLGAKTISIGNLTTGGTGKTPLVGYVTDMLAQHGEKVCILTRGYGRANANERVVVSDGQTVLADARHGGDEPVELAHKLIGKAIVIADSDRVSAARWALTEFGVTAFVLDDGFQHRRAVRDLDIVCIDATNPFGNHEMLPAGRLRERLTNLGRAHVAMITRANLVRDVANLEKQVRSLSPEVEIFAAANEISRLIDLGSGKAASIDEVKSSKVFAFCGVGNPDSFFAQLANDGFNLVGKKAFRDHHYYVQDDLNTIDELARGSGAEMLITTAKDAARLSESRSQLRCIVTEIEVRMNYEKRFRELIISS
ncbi:MAG TPA: tetraacyldisaccharide 4'-kinase [Pyrinomonadaceae bacterium]|nr:tetraacyldisaccharide 4'-kinase [Pyrinomonadaceae bacterium]